MNTSSGDNFHIRGLGGKKTLKGSVSIQGAKNAALKAMAATVLFSGTTILKNIPDNADVKTQIELLTKLGATVSVRREEGNGLTLEINTDGVSSGDIDHALGEAMRSSVVLTGPLLSRLGRATAPAPGGCVIGARPIDLFVDGYAKLGATTTEDDRSYHFNAPHGLKGSEIEFAKISVGATETLMMAAAIADGTTILRNCACEPEIGNVGEWLNACGADISGIGTRTLTIKGTGGKLLQPKAPYIAIPDRIETGSFLFLGALCAEELEIKNCNPDHLKGVIDALTQASVPISCTKNSISIKGNTQPNSSFASFDIHTSEYPGFPTDLQSPAVTFLTQVSGQSEVEETIFEGRFKHIEDLNTLGASVEMVSANEIKVKGPTPLVGTNEKNEFAARDIRSGFALVMAALVAEGEFKISNVKLIDRGYEKLEERLKGLGAEIRRI